MKSCRDRRKSAVRSFIIPKLNFQASDYTEIIFWSKEKLTPPPLLRNISDEAIRTIISNKTIPDWDVRSFPCHTQAVERCVKLVTTSAQEVVGFQNRDGWIRATLKSREIMPTFNTKKEFAVLSMSSP
jgi:hypothetical protein